MSDDERILLDAGSSGRGWTWRSDILRCLHKFALREAGYVGADRDALLRGGLAHVGLAHYFAQRQAVQLGDDPDEFYAPIEAMSVVCDRKPEYEPFFDVCAAAVEAHAKRYFADRHRILAVEELVVMDIVGPRTGKTYRHTARIDLITELHGKVYVVDHKTHGAPVDKKKRGGFMLSGQTIGLTRWGLETYGNALGGFMINLLRMDLKDLKMERFHPPVAPYAISMFPAVIEHTEELLLWARANYGEDPDNWPPTLQEQGPCMDRYGPCEFIEKCRWGRQ